MIALVKRRIKSAAKKLNFYDAGNFLIGRHTRDIVSGLALDATPQSVYVWTFLLPRFDNIDFLHMTLGERVIDASASDYPIVDVLQNVWNTISDVGNAYQLIGYLDKETIAGEYATWTRFLSLVRIGDFEEAELMVDAVATLSTASIPRKLNELQDVRRYGGWRAVQDLLDDWSCQTDELIEGVPLEG